MQKVIITMVERNQNKPAKSRAEIEHDEFIKKTMQEMIDIAPDGSEEDDGQKPSKPNKPSKN